MPLRDARTQPDFPSPEEELAFYKRVIEELPIDLDYLDKQTNIRIKKQQKDHSFSMTNEGRPIPKKEFGYATHEFERVEKFLEPILDVVPHHIVLIDQHGIITFCNKQTLLDLNETKEQVIGSHISHLLKIEDSEIKLLETLNTGREFHNEEILDSNYGIINTKIIYDENGNVLRVMGLFHFLNYLKEAEKMRMLGQISASIAHEVRNPLTTVRGFLQLMEQGKVEGTPELLGTLLLPELDRANKIISDFLMVSKETPMTNKPENVTDLMGHFNELLYSDALLKNVDLTISMDEELKDAFILVNKNELIQVLLNLFNNAVEAKGTNNLEVRLECKRDRTHILFKFQDNGVGIDSQHLKYIFDPFFSTKEEGTGLGLSLSKKIIELHGGTLAVISTPNIGTTFTFKIPIFIE